MMNEKIKKKKLKISIFEFTIEAYDLAFSMWRIDFLLPGCYKVGHNEQQSS